MKRFLLVIAVLLFILPFSCTAYAETSDVTEQPQLPPLPDTLLETAYFVQQLCSLNHDYATANGASKAASKERVTDFLLMQFRAAIGEECVGGDKNDSAVNKFYVSQDQIAGYNIEAKLDVENTDECVVIGAHYDALGAGAVDNATGVAVLLQAAQTLARQRDKLPFDVYFVAFDCEEDMSYGYFLGSEKFITHLSERHVYLDDIAVMFNVDCIAVGDLYLMCENKRTDLADLICSQSEQISEKPYAQGVNADMDVYDYGYYESIQNSDHTSFRRKGVPTALLFAGSYNLLGYMDGSDNVNSVYDTFENLVKSNPDYVQRISAVSDIICNTLLDENFADVAHNARSQLVDNDLLYNRWWPSLVVLGVLVILAVFTWLYHRKLQKKALLGHSEVKQNAVFEKPQADDIFRFDGAEKQQDKPQDNADDSKPDVDDIFTFKK